MLDAAQKADACVAQTGKVFQAFQNRSAKIHDTGIDEDFRHEQIDEDDLIGELAEFADFLGRKFTDANQAVQHRKLA